MADDDFASKLELVLKGLSINRSRLPAELGVTKSQVSRWISGVNTPKAHNLALLTEFIARRRPDFSLLHWELSLDELSAVLSVSPSPKAGRVPPQPGQLALNLTPEVADAARARAHAYEGIWRLTFSAGVADRPEMFAHGYVLVRRGPDGLLTYRAGVFGLQIEGWGLTANGQFYALGVSGATGGVSLAVFNGVAGDRAEILDGLILSASRDRGGVPTSVACLSERLFDLSTDVAADEARYQSLLALPPVAAEDAAPEAVRKHLLRDIGPAAVAAGGDLLLIMPALRSMSR